MLDRLSSLSGAAAARGAEDLLELWRRIPHGTEGLTSFNGISFALPGGFDFRRAMEGAIELQSSPQAVFPSGLMAKWAATDPEAAAAFVAENGANRKIDGVWLELRSSIAKREGKEEGQRWTLDFFSRMPSETLPTFFANANLLTSSSSVLGSLPADAPADEHQRLVAGLRESAAARNWDSIYTHILNQVRAADRLPALAAVRGLADPELLLKQTREAGADESEIENLRSLMTRPR